MNSDFYLEDPIARGEAEVCEDCDEQDCVCGEPDEMYAFMYED